MQSPLLPPSSKSLPLFLVTLLIVLITTRVGIELSVHLLPMHLSWIMAFGCYYLSIETALWFLKIKSGLSRPQYTWALSPLPPLKPLLVGLVLPALLPLGVFVANYQQVPAATFTYIFVFAAINPFFEEVFWRGVLNQLPISRVKRQVTSALLFSFSHYFLWGSYWLSNPKILIPTCITTFIMGWCWMWFYQRDGRLLYPVLSHMAVDVFNLSIAVFMGIDLVGAR